MASMRPSGITDGILGPRVRERYPRMRVPRFNEAVGYYRRNPAKKAVYEMRLQ